MFFEYSIRSILSFSGDSASIVSGLPLGLFDKRFAAVAQLVEYILGKDGVMGSNPVSSTNTVAKLGSKLCIEKNGKKILSNLNFRE